MICTLVFALKGEISSRSAIFYVLVQVLGGIVGVWTAHLMFDVSVIQFSEKARTGTDQWFAEFVAIFGLQMTILGALRARGRPVAMAVGLYITAVHWFTASTSFANPAVTVARSFSNTFAGIDPAHVTAFIAAQLAGAMLASYAMNWILVPTD